VQNLCRRQNDKPYDQRASTKEPEAAKNQYLNPKNVGLLGLFVWGMLPAAIAKLREFKPARGRLLILRRRVIPLFAFRTLECDYFTHSLS
jgi:hypothetical protein